MVDGCGDTTPGGSKIKSCGLVAGEGGVLHHPLKVISCGGKFVKPLPPPSPGKESHEAALPKASY